MASLKDLQTQDLTHTYRKMLPFTFNKAEDKSDPDVAGEIEGFAAGLLNIDKGEDLIFPGAFETADPEETVVAYQHDITAILGRPLEMQERYAPDYGLFTRSEIVATTLGTDVMKLVRRKILKKMSIGYRLVKEGYSVLNRESLEATLKSHNYNGHTVPPEKTTEILADYDRRKLDGVFGLFKLNLREYSIVTFPMNDDARITGAKDEWGGLLDSLPFQLHPALVLAANKGYVERARDLFQRIKRPENKALGDSHREALEIIADEGAKVAIEARELLQAMSALKSGDSTTSVDEATLIAQFLTLDAEIEARVSGALPPGFSDTL
jgi:HK97 family phage prohead protease